MSHTVSGICDILLILYCIIYMQASKMDRDRRDKPRGIEGDRDGIGMENSEP